MLHVNLSIYIYTHKHTYTCLMYLNISTYVIHICYIHVVLYTIEHTHICHIHVLNKCVVHLYTYTTILYMKRNNQFMIDFTKLTPVDSTLNTIVAFFTISINVLFSWKNHIYLVTSDFGPWALHSVFAIVPSSHGLLVQQTSTGTQRMCDVNFMETRKISPIYIP